jgi:thiol-disulfide isomerase/thioredoxin
MQRLVRFFSFNSYYFLSNAVGLVLAVALLRDGLSALDAALVLAYVVGVGWLVRRLRQRARPAPRFDAMAAFDQALRDPRPTMLEFYSDNCAVCMSTQPVMERLAQEVGHRLQILRVNVGEPVGLAIANRYDVTFTPTYVLLNGAGKKDEEFTLFLDRPRVRYWLDQQTISAPLPGIGHS